MLMSKRINLITILGPTASGKTSLAAHLAYEINTEIISADSRQVYRNMDLGTGKDYQEYFISGKKIPVHLVDIVDAGYQYNVYEYQRDFLKAYEKITSKQKIPVLCGGTGMYIEAVLKGYKLIRVPVNPALRETLAEEPVKDLIKKLESYKVLHNTTDITRRKRLIRAIEIEEYYLEHPEAESEYPDIHPFIAGVDPGREIRRKRITERLKKRLHHGMVEEVKELLKQGINKDILVYYGLEYKYITLYVLGEISYEEMFRKLETAIHQFAKRNA
jgi:tRNA dimethylallyltransferase